MKSRQSSFLRSRLIFIVVIAVVVIAAAVWIFGPGQHTAPAPQITLAPAPQITFTPPPDLGDLARQFPRLEKILNNPELDSVYKDFLVAYERGSVAAAESLARQRGLLTPDNQIRVTLVLDTEDSAALVAELRNLGVIVRGTYRDLVDIGIPLELIVKTAQSEEPGKVFDQITQLEHVINLQLPAPGKPNAETQPADTLAGFLQPPPPVASEGVKVIGADRWHAAGYTGQGMKVGILDQGFDGYRNLLGRELPSRVTTQSFVPGIEVDQTGISHGAAVAEVIHDVAPDAALYLAYYDGGDVSMGNAVEWLLQQGVHIISHSAGGLAAPMDGTGRDDELVKLAADNGALWINSAGNNGTQIVFAANYTEASSIWLMDRDGANPHRIRKIIGWDPTWSPNGEQILFASTDTDGTNQLFVMDKNGANKSRISSLPSIRGRSDWSPDGQRIVTYSGEAWHREVYIMNADGSADGQDPDCLRRDPRRLG